MEKEQVDTLDTDHLANLLLDNAEHPSAQAAIRLLAGHGVWLRRPDFRHDAVRYRAGSEHEPEEASIHWDSDPDAFACSTSERSILALALSLGGHARTVNLSTALSGLDPHNQQLVQNAVAETMNPLAGE